MKTYFTITAGRTGTHWLSSFLSLNLEIISDAKKPSMVHIPKNIPSAHVNLSNDISTVLTLADLAWKPNDNEMLNISFDDYDWSKWKKSI